MQLSQGELHALRTAAERAWDDDTRHSAYAGHPLRSAGQCYVTSRWLADRLGGHVARKDGHYFYVDPDERHAVDLTGDQFHYPPMDPKLADMVEPDDDGNGLVMEDHHKTWRPGPVVHKETSHPYFAGYEIVPPVQDEQADRFSKRADRIFDNPDALLKEADLAGDAYPAETPQAIADMGQRHFHAEPGFQPETAEYKFVYANGQLEVSPDHDHEQLAGHAGIAPEHTGPVAMGSIVVDRGQARFEVTGNIGARAIVRVLKDYAKHVGWKWGGLTDIEGWPVSDEFSGQKRSRLYFSWDSSHLSLSQTFRPIASSGGRILGYLDIDEVDLHVRVVPTRLPEYFASLRRIAHDDMVALGSAVIDWAQDNGFTVVGLSDNVIKTIEDLSEHNLYDPNPTQPDDHQYPAGPTDERQPGGVYRCPQCDVVFPTWGSYQEHRRSEEPFGDDPLQNSGFPEEPALGVQEQHPYVSMTTVKQASRVPGFQGHQEGDQYAVAYRHGCALGYARLREGKLNEIRSVDPSVELPLMHKLVRVADKAPKDMLEGPLPFIYDVQEDKLDFGQPNTRISDIPGQFTPGGIVEGIYEPSGKVYIRTVTNMPYTVRHLLELWYAVNPMLEVRSVHLKDDAGRDTRLASSDRTGDLVLDGLISQFAQSEVQAHGGAPSLPVSRWRERDWALGNCNEATEHFVNFLNSHGINAYGTESTRAEEVFGADAATPDWVGYSDRPERGDSGHEVAVVEKDGATYLIDWTAAQYGYSEFPKVTKIDERFRRSASADVGGYIAAMVAADPAAAASSRALQHAGGNTFAVGGAVRDAIMGKEPKDIDLMVTGLPPEQVRKTLEALPGKVDLTGKDFGVFRYRNNGHEVEIALPRRERSTGAGHQDFDVQADHTMSPEEDLYRRDFTANAMAVDLSNGHLIDPFGGAQDIENGDLRTLNDTSLSEDPLRVVRALVAHGKHGLHPDEATKAQMQQNAASIQHLPAERIQAELDKLFKAKDPASAIRLARETGVLPYILPEVDDAFGFDQNNPHHELELGEHLLSVLHRVSQISDDPDVRLAALLHDVGKPASAWQDPDPNKGTHYYYNKELGLGQDHEVVGSDMARERLRALKYPNDRIDRVSDLVKHHMYAPFTTEKGARRFMNRVGDHADDLLHLRWADQGGKAEYPNDGTGNLSLDTERQLLERVRTQGQATTQAALAINGHDLIQQGFKPGPQMGQILQSLTEAVIDNPELNTREALLGLARSYA